MAGLVRRWDKAYGIEDAGVAAYADAVITYLALATQPPLPTFGRQCPHVVGSQSRGAGPKYYSVVKPCRWFGTYAEENNVFNVHAGC